MINLPARCRDVFGLLAAMALLAALALPNSQPARAQSGSGSAVITAVDAGNFPEIGAYVQLHDAQGERVSGLRASAFQLFENGQAVAGLSAAEEDVGVQVVFVIDATEPFKVRDARGVTRLEYVQAALEDFATGTAWMRGGLDDVTVLASDAVIIEHSNNPPLVAQSVAGYSTSFGGAANTFPLLNQGLDYAATATRRPGMRRFLIYISNGIPDGVVADVIARATAAQVPIFTVYVGPAGSEATVGANNLQRLSQQTGGQRLVFEDPESFRPLFQMLSDHGRQYRLSYRSTLASTGQHWLQVRAAIAEGAEVASEEAVFPLRVLTPMVAVQDLPDSIVRVAPAHDAEPAAAEPAAYEVRAAIDFPDGHQRSVRLAELVVDGQPVASLRDQAGPMLLLAWPLAQYAESAEHSLQVRVMDELGLIAESAVLTVNVSLQVPAAPPAAETGIAALPAWPFLAAAAAGLLLAAAIGAAAWAMVARRAEAEPEAEAPARSASAGWSAADIEATMPARPPAPRNGQPDWRGQEGQRAPAPTRRGLSLPPFRWPGRASRPAPRAAASLEVVEPGGGGSPRADIELISDTITLGRDAAVAEAVFHDRSVSRLHARIAAEDGGFRVYDAGSTSGTWVNYVPVPADAGCLLRHGDLINLGRVQLRFKLREAETGVPQPGGVRVAPAEPKDKDGL
jgi:hypothetical protein